MQVLEDKIKHVKTSTDTLMQETFEEKTNEFLDGANELKKGVRKLSREFNDLNEDLFVYTNNNKKKALENLESMKALLTDVNKFIAGLKKEEVFCSILKTEIKELSVEASQLKEIIQDIQMKYIDLPENKELQNIMKKINDKF